MRELKILESNNWNLIQITGLEIYQQLMNILSQYILSHTEDSNDEKAKELEQQLEKAIDRTTQLAMLIIHLPIVNDLNFL